MGEIIVIHVGQCGIQMGVNFWESLAAEHGINSTGNCIAKTTIQTQQRHVFFREKNSKHFVPRAIFIDLDPKASTVIQASSLNPLFPSTNLVFGSDSANNNWAKGHYTEGAELREYIFSVINQEIADCDNLQGFIIMHSMGGGTGSGLGTLILSRLRDEYTDKSIVTCSVFPAAQDTTTAPYNAALAFAKLFDNADLIFCFDNEALYDICTRELHIPQPSTHNYNALITPALSHITAPLRFPSQNNPIATLLDMTKYFIEFNRDEWKLKKIKEFEQLKQWETEQKCGELQELEEMGELQEQQKQEELRILAEQQALEKQDYLAHLEQLQQMTDQEELETHKPERYPAHFLNISLALPKATNHQGLDFDRDLFEKNILTHIMPFHGLYLAGVGIIRGSNTQSLADIFLKDNTIKRGTWLQPPLVLEIPLAHKSNTPELALISNTTAFLEMLKRLAEQFTLLFRRKTFLHWYTGEGMDEMEFTEAESQLSDLVTYYQGLQEAYEERQMAKTKVAEES